MILSLTTSGGFGGFGLGRSAEIVVEDLPDALRTEVCSRLDATTLAQLARSATEPSADGVTYHITVDMQDGMVAKFDVREADLPPETLDLIDNLMAEK